MKKAQTAAAAVFFILLALLIAAACWVYVQERYEDGYSDGYRAAVEKMMIAEESGGGQAPALRDGSEYIMIPLTQAEIDERLEPERATSSDDACGGGQAPALRERNERGIWTEEEMEALAVVIYQEAGADSCSDETRRMVADVVLNRVLDERFPGSIEGVLLEKWQYGMLWQTGIIWPESAQYACNEHAVERARRIAEEVLCGQHSEIYGAGYVFQAEFGQGSEGFWEDGIYFGR